MSLYNELKRRNVIRVAAAYIAIAWVILQAVDVVLNNIQAPVWIFQVLLLILCVGFIPTVLFAWAFELTPEGLKRESDVLRDASVAQRTGRKLTVIIVAFVSIGLAYVLYGKLIAPGMDEQATTAPEVLSDVVTESAAKGLSTAEDNSIAVLPFTNMSGDTGTEPFTMGIHDDLLTHLSRIRALKTTSRTSVLQYKDTIKTIPQIAGELIVANILEGSIQRSGDRVRINMQLIDARTDEHLWAEIYDRELTAENLFEVQGEIAMAVTDALSATLLPQEQAALAETPTQSLEAYDLYLAGRYHWYEQTAESAEQALEYFRQAIEVDPDYVLALAGLADAYVAQEQYGNLPRQEALGLAQEAVDRALDLDDAASEVWASLGLVRQRTGDYAGAAEALEKSIELDPQNFWAWYRYSKPLYTLRRFSDSLEANERAYELEPMFRPLNESLARQHRDRGNFQRALHHYERVDQLAGQDITQWKEQIAWTYFESGQLARAVATARRVLVLDPTNTQAQDLLNMSYTQLGDLDQAELWEERSLALQSFNSGMVFIYLARQEYQLAIDFIEDWLQRWGSRPASMVGLAFYVAMIGDMEETAAAYMDEYMAGFSKNFFPPSSPYNWSPVQRLPGTKWLLNYAQRNDGRQPVLNGENVDLSNLRETLASTTADLEYMMDQGYKHPATSYTYAALLLLQNDPEGALEHLAVAINDGLTPSILLTQDPLLDPLRSDPRFQALMRQHADNVGRERSRLQSMTLPPYRPPAPQKITVLSRSVIKQYEGYFSNDNVVLHFYLDEQDQFTVQVAQLNAPESLVASEVGVFFNPDTPGYAWRFEKGDQGAVTHVILERDGNEFRYKATPPPPKAIELDREILERYLGTYRSEQIKGAETTNENFDNWRAKIFLDEAGDIWLHFYNQSALKIRPFSETEFFVPGFMGFTVFAIEAGEEQALQFTMQWPAEHVIFKRVE